LFATEELSGLQDLVVIDWTQDCAIGGGALSPNDASRGWNAVVFGAVGTALGHNPIPLLIPCHRVVGSDGALTGYAGGLDRKRRLLALEAGSDGLRGLRIANRVTTCAGV
jgi:O-6-methylguanine DNA methyltransferase